MLLAGALIALMALPAAAQNAPEGTPTRIRGTVEKLDGQTLTVKSREGQQLTIALAPNFTVSAVVKKSLADIKAGDYVGAASTKGTDGKLHAIEVLIFPEALRGAAEGERRLGSRPRQPDDQCHRRRHRQRGAGPGSEGHLQGRRVGNHRRIRYARRHLCAG